MKADIRRYIIEKLELDDADTIAMLLVSFTESLNDNVSMLEASLAVGDTAKGAGVAHAMKGASANIGAEPIFAVCRELEHTLKGGDLAEGRRLLVTLLALREAFLQEK